MFIKLFGLCFLFGALATVYLFEGQAQAPAALPILYWPAIALTGIGPLGIVLLSTNWKLLRQTIGILMGEAPEPRARRYQREAMFLQKLADSIYKEGPRILDTIKTGALSPFTKKVLERLSLRIPIPDIRSLLEAERNRRIARIIKSVNLVSLAVRLSPSIGMLGTILGMVRLLASLDDPSHIGPQISTALFTTFYGLFFSLAVWTPVQQRLERSMEAETEGLNQLVRWLEFLEKRKPLEYFADTAEIKVEKAATAG